MERTPEEIEKAKRIMSVPVNPRKTQEYYMSLSPLKTDDNELITLKQNAFTQGY